MSKPVFPQTWQRDVRGRQKSLIGFSGGRAKGKQPKDMRLSSRLNFTVAF